jgi:hypothetical protein
MKKTTHRSLTFLKEIGDDVERIGSENHEEAMYNIGVATGRDLFDHFVKNVRSDEHRLKRVLEILNLTDYGKFEFKSISRRSIVVSLIESPIMDICIDKKTDKHWLCDWMSGLLNGLFWNIDKRWSFERLSCNRIKNRCEFKGTLL